MAGDIHPLLRMYFPEDKPMYLYSTYRLVAEGFAKMHGVEKWKHVGPKDVRKMKIKKGMPIVLLYDYNRRLIRSLQEAGFKTYTPEGFEYKYNFS